VTGTKIKFHGQLLVLILNTK